MSFYKYNEIGISNKINVQLLPGVVLYYRLTFHFCLLPASVVCPSILTVEQPYFRFTYFRFGLIFVHAPER